MSTRRRQSKGHSTAVVNVGCRGWRLNLRSLLSPSPKPKPLETNAGPSSSRYGDFASDLFRPERDQGKIEFKKSGSAELAARMGIEERSVALVKESSDPHQDFGDSMLQMILEMEICTWEDLCDLLRRFLALNAPHHHRVILSAFAEVCSLIFSTPCRLRARPAAAIALEGSQRNPKSRDPDSPACARWYKPKRRAAIADGPTEL